MAERIGLILNYNNNNRNSFNALLGALEVNPDIDVDLFFAKSTDEIIKLVSLNSDKYHRIVIAFSFFTQYFDRIRDSLSSLISFLNSKKIRDKTILIAGGPHPSGDPKGTLSMGFDVVFVGESEFSFPAFLRAVSNKEDFSNIKGILFRSSEELVFTGKPEKVDLDYYPPFSPKYLKFGPIELTRGCPYGCYYCQTPQLFGGRVRHRSEDVVIEWVKNMRMHRLRDIRYISPDAFAYMSKDGKKIEPDALESLFSRIFEVIKPHGRQFIGSFPSEVRPEHVTEETLLIVKKYASNDNIIIGAQTGSPRMLKLIHRGHTIEDVYNAVKLSLKFGLKPNVDFIFGLPGEDEEDLKLTAKMMKEITEMGAVIHAHVFTPLPQTAFAKYPKGKISKALKDTIRDLARKRQIYGRLF